MPLINTSVANLIQGVSQQPDSSRYDGQCEEQENALSSIVDGLTKRPSTKHVARLLQVAIDANSFIHFIDRDDAEKYVVIHDGSAIRAWNMLTGVEANINGATGGLDISSHAYLNPATPRAALKATTIGDSTFLLNTTQDVSRKSQGEFTVSSDNGYNITMDASFNPADYTFPAQAEILTGAQKGQLLKIVDGTNTNPSTTFKSNTDRTNLTSGDRVRLLDSSNIEIDASSAYVYVSQALYNTTYSMRLENDAGISYIEYTTAATGSISHVGIRNALSGHANWSGSGKTGAARTNIGSVGFVISNMDTVAHPADGSRSFTIDEFGNQTFQIDTAQYNQGLQAVYREVGSITDLPTFAPHGLKCKIKGDDELAQDDHYVKFVAEGVNEFPPSSYTDSGQGVWEETIGDCVPKGVESNTMPHRLINTGVNEFTLESIAYSERAVGDLTSNPDPSFVNKKIHHIFLCKNRLGFVCEDSVIMSEAGEFFNFYRTTAQSLLDSAPIDVTVASSRVTNLRYATGFQENLVLFGDRGQFVLKGGELLTPKTVSITPITNFEFQAQVAPLPLGSYVYFPFSRGGFSGLREFTVNATSDTYDSVDITNHVPNYIPDNIVQLDGTSSEDMLVAVSASEPSTAYVYKYFWSGNQKVLSSWSKFKVRGDIRGIHFVESTLYMVIAHNGETQLLEMPLESGTKDPSGYLTHLDMRVARTVTAGSNSITLPYSVTAADNLQVWTKDGAFLASTSHVNSVQLSQPVDVDTEVWVGLPYKMKYTFSEQVFKAAAGQGKSPSNIANVMLRNVNLFYSDTAAFNVKITPKFRDTFTSVFTPSVVGSSTIGTLTLDSGAFRVPVFTKATETVITIESDSALPCSFQSAEFESFIHSRSNRYN